MSNTDIVKEAKNELYELISILLENKSQEGVSDEELERYSLDICAYYNNFEAFMNIEKMNARDYLEKAIEEIRSIK